jgi:hypothetical protein
VRRPHLKTIALWHFHLEFTALEFLAEEINQMPGCIERLYCCNAVHIDSLSFGSAALMLRALLVDCGGSNMPVVQYPVFLVGERESSRTILAPIEERGSSNLKSWACNSCRL